MRLPSSNAYPPDTPTSAVSSTTLKPPTISTLFLTCVLAANYLTESAARETTTNSASLADSCLLLAGSDLISTTVMQRALFEPLHQPSTISIVKESFTGTSNQKTCCLDPRQKTRNYVWLILVCVRESYVIMLRVSLSDYLIHAAVENNGRQQIQRFDNYMWDTRREFCMGS